MLPETERERRDGGARVNPTGKKIKLHRQNNEGKRGLAEVVRTSEPQGLPSCECWIIGGVPIWLQVTETESNRLRQRGHGFVSHKVQRKVDFRATSL